MFCKITGRSRVDLVKYEVLQHVCIVWMEVILWQCCWLNSILISSLLCVKFDKNDDSLMSVWHQWNFVGLRFHWSFKFPFLSVMNQKRTKIYFVLVYPIYSLFWTFLRKKYASFFVLPILNDFILFCFNFFRAIFNIIRLYLEGLLNYYNPDIFKNCCNCQFQVNQ